MTLRVAVAVLLLSSCAHAAPHVPAAGAAPRCDYETQVAEARYNNGDVSLAAAWHTPVGVSEAPAIVIIQGSGASDRGNAWAAMIAREFTRCGVAVLLTDKRGAGASGGSWRTSSMLDLAGDAAAGMDWVLRQRGVDRDRVGFLGLSQGGQVAPAAALRVRETDFVVGWVTSVGPMKETFLYELEQTYRQHSLNDEQIEPFQEMARASFHWLETGEGWERYLALRAELASGPLAAATVSWPTNQSDEYWTFWRLNGGYDPLPHWDTVVRERRLPSLIVLGENDARDNVNVPGTVGALRDHFGADFRVEVIPGVGHSLQTAPDEIHPLAIEATLELVRSSNRR